MMDPKRNGNMITKMLLVASVIFTISTEVGERKEVSHDYYFVCLFFFGLGCFVLFSVVVSICIMHLRSGVSGDSMLFLAALTIILSIVTAVMSIYTEQIQSVKLTIFILKISSIIVESFISAVQFLGEGRVNFLQDLQKKVRQKCKQNQNVSEVMFQVGDSVAVFTIEQLRKMI